VNGERSSVYDDNIDCENGRAVSEAIFGEIPQG
jgi:hypothetical protein